MLVYRRHALTAPLRLLARGYATPAIKGLKDFRVHITSDKLCEDIIARLAPTLPTSPIDIIDAYPGVGVFSSHFHNHIQPRKHILLEPNFRAYQRFLQPLLDTPDSRYTHLPWDPADERTFFKLFKQGHLPEQTTREKGSTEENDTLLVLANFTLLRSSTNLRTLESRRYIEAMLNQSYFHQYGLVRIIAVFPSSNLDAVLPKSISRRRRTQALLESVAAEANEVAGDTSEITYWTRRGLGVLQKSAELAAKRMEAEGTDVPKGREGMKLKLAPETGAVDGAVLPYFPRPYHDWHAEYLDARKAANDEKSKLEDEAELSPKYKELRKKLSKLQKRYLFEGRQIQGCHKADGKQSEIDDIVAHLRRVMEGSLPMPSPTEAQRMITDLARLEAERDAIIEKLGIQFYSHHYPMFMSERRSIAGPSGVENSPSEPLLLWDKRPYEPLHVHADEFSPAKPCSILDIRPNSRSPVFETQRKLRAEGQSFKYISILTTYLALLRMLIPNSKKSVEPVLRQVFGSRPITDFPLAIPSLAAYAAPKITLDAQEAATWGGVKSEAGVFVGYDADCLAEATMHRIPTVVFWDIAAEWERWREERGLPDTIKKLLGGAVLSIMNEAFGRRR